ncbi:MAG: polysaccharide biosynthesis tyrosine autokinase [Candidatus Aerophobus sp.]|nr:MAG: polysaccharide biosynthesis tyrosine autokinase [Candidatus Aerophobus sp.]
MYREEESVELRQYWQVLWRHKWIVLLAVVVVFVGTMIFTYRQALVYRASSKVLINPPPSLYPYTAPGQILTSQGLPYSRDLPYYINYLENYRVWLTSETMMDKIIERVKSLYPKSEEIPFSMGASVIRDTSIFAIGIESGDPELCKVAANATAQVLVEENQKMFAAGLKTASEMMKKQIQTPLEELSKLLPGSELPGKGVDTTKGETPESQLWQAAQLNNVRIMDYAKTPHSPIKPRKKLNAMLGLLVGFMLGGGLAFLLAYLDTSVRSIEDVEKYFSWPVLGIIPRFDHADEEPSGKTSPSEIEPVVSKYPKSVSAEAYRTLRTNIQLSNLDHPPRFLVITSAGPLEGKSTTALNLAVALAQRESKVLLVDGDLRKSTIHKALHLDNSTGLADSILNHGSLEAAIKRIDSVANLSVLTSGSAPSNPSELLGSGRMRSLVEQVKKEYDYVVFDTPPLMSVSDGAVLASQADGILVVISPGKLRREIALRTKELLDRIGTPVLGCVLNGVEPSHSNYYYYYHYYHSYADSEGKETIRQRKKKKRSS